MYLQMMYKLEFVNVLQERREEDVGNLEDVLRWRVKTRW